MNIGDVPKISPLFQYTSTFEIRGHALDPVIVTLILLVFTGSIFSILL